MRTSVLAVKQEGVANAEVALVTATVEEARRHAVKAQARHVAMAQVEVSAHVVKEARAAKAMIAVVRRAVLGIVIAVARRSVSGWRFPRTCRS